MTTGASVQAGAAPGRIEAMAGWLRAHPWRAAAALISLIPPIGLFWLVGTHLSNAPFYDSWTAALVALPTSQGKLDPGLLFRQINEHRVFFTNLMVALNTLITRWDVRAEVVVCAAAACASFAVLLTLLGRKEPGLFWYLLIPFSLFFFSVRQYENWLWGFELSFFAVTGFLLAAIAVVCLRPAGWKTLLLAALWVTCASYSMLVGGLGWALVPAGMWLMGWRSRRHYAAWAAIGVAVIGLYGIGYTRVSGATYTLNPARIIPYAGVYLASPFMSIVSVITHPALVASIGLAGLALALGDGVVLWRRPRELAPWLLMVGLGAGAALITAPGRAGGELVQAASPRYVTISNFFWLGLFGMAGQVVRMGWRGGRWARLAAAAHLVILLAAPAALVYDTWAWEVGGMLQFAARQQAGEACLRQYPLTQDIGCADDTYPRLEVPRRFTPMMISQRLGVYARPYDVPLAALDETQDGPTISVDLHPIGHFRRIVLRGTASPGGVRVTVTTRAGRASVLFDRVVSADTPVELDLTGFAGKFIRLALAGKWINPVIALGDDLR